MPLTIRDFKVYMPAKDLEQSKRFYTALGFKMSEGWGGTADFELNGNRFRLQNYYVKYWAGGIEDQRSHFLVRGIESRQDRSSVDLGPQLVQHIIKPHLRSTVKGKLRVHAFAPDGFGPQVDHFPQ